MQGSFISMNIECNQSQVVQELDTDPVGFKKERKKKYHNFLPEVRMSLLLWEGCSIIGHERFLAFSCDVPKHTVLVTVREKILDYMDH